MSAIPQNHNMPVWPSRNATRQFSMVESFAPIFREAIWQQSLELKASSGEARTKLAYARARSLVKAISKTSAVISECDQY